MAFTFIAYKRDSEDTCRGCHMASYPSDFISESQLSADQLKDSWAEVLLKNKRLLVNEAGYQIQVFNNGILAYSDHGSTEHYDDYDDANQHITDAITGVHIIKALAETECESRNEAHIRKEKEASLARWAEKANQEKEDRRKTFERLQAEFGT